MSLSSTLKCRAFKSLGADLVDASLVAAPLAHHAETCLRCQAEVARYRRLQRELSALADHREPAPRNLADRIDKATWDDVLPDSVHHQLARTVATIAGATAAAAGVVVVAMWRKARSAAA